MVTLMDTKQIQNIITEYLPELIKTDPELRALIHELNQKSFADREETKDRFDEILRELRQDREMQFRKWQEQSEIRKEQDKRWNQQAEKWKEQDKKWWEQAERWKEQDKRWEQQAEKWKEQDKKWWENQKVIQQTQESLVGLDKKIDRQHDRTLGALGARWGLYAEESFRRAMQGILEDHFDIQVLHVNEFDDQGFVFNRPDQVEIDVIIVNNSLILCEIKSSVSKSDLHIFERKVRFYEQQHRRTATQMIVISPMVEEAAHKLARKLNIKVYSYPEDVEKTVLQL